MIAFVRRKRDVRLHCSCLSRQAMCRLKVGGKERLVLLDEQLVFCRYSGMDEFARNWLGENSHAARFHFVTQLTNA